MLGGMSVWWVLLGWLVGLGAAQLTVNVRNRGGDVMRETIQSDVAEDTITLEFQEADGTFITQFIDFRNEVQIFKVLVLGEEERGQGHYQVMCFIMRFIKNEFISSDAMSKLRQKNPGAVRHPEEEKGTETFLNDLQIDLNRSQYLSPFISPLCLEARDATYIRDADLKSLSKLLGKDYNALVAGTRQIPFEDVTRCSEVKDTWRPCSCQYQVCVGWFPCGLKYCRGKDSSGKVVSYRCGIKTCRKCRRFIYYVRQKFLCLWDEE